MFDTNDKSRLHQFGTKIISEIFIGLARHREHRRVFGLCQEISVRTHSSKVPNRSFLNKVCAFLSQFEGARNLGDESAVGRKERDVTKVISLLL